MEQSVELKAIENLKKVGGDPFIKKMILLFIETSSQKLEEILKNPEDFETVKFNAHSIKSSAGNFGAQRLAHLCQSIETETKNALSNGLPQLIHDLSEEIKKVQETLQGELKKLKE